MSNHNPRGRWVAIVTGALSVAIALAYLLLVLLLDRQGPLLPPPAEALGGAVIGDPSVSMVPPPGLGPPPGSA
jgi:hypothetical protein